MQEWRKVGLFLLAGALNTGFGFVVYALLVFAQFPVWATVTLSMIAALIFNYLTYGGLVFKDLSRRNLPRFVAFYVMLATGNTALLHVMAQLDIGPLLAQAILVPPMAVISYLGLSFFVFAKSHSQLS